MSDKDTDRWYQQRLEEAHQSAVGYAKATFDSRRPEGAKAATKAKRAVNPGYRLRKNR